MRFLGAVLRMIAKIYAAIAFVIGTVVLGIVVLVAYLFTLDWDLPAFVDDGWDTSDQQYILRLDSLWRTDDQAIASDLRKLFRDPAADITMFEIAHALDRAADDARIAGVFFDFSNVYLSPYEAEQLSQAIVAFRAASDKPTMGYYAGFADNAFFEAAAMSSFETTLIHPQAHIVVGGMAIERAYVGDALTEYDIGFEVLQRHEYKSAMESVQRAGPSAATVETDNLLLNQIYNDISARIASNKNYPPQIMDSLRNAGPIGAVQAQQDYGLFTHIADYSERDAMLDAWVAADTAAFVDVDDYIWHDTPGDAPADRMQIYVLQLHGEIMGGGLNQFSDAAAVLDALGTLHALAAEGKVDGIVMTINSPGGEFGMTDRLYRAIQTFKAAWPGIPIVAQLQDVAASGGYYAALPADRIVAGTTSLTGSIGVLAGKVTLDKFAKNFGVNVVTNQRGAFATMWSPFVPFSEQTRQGVARVMDAAYARFTDVVVQNRDLAQPIDALARGRVFTGSIAHDGGLVDRLGGYDAVIDAMRALSGDQRAIAFHYVTPDTPVWLRFTDGHFGALARSYLHGTLHDMGMGWLWPATRGKGGIYTRMPPLNVTG